VEELPKLLVLALELVGDLFPRGASGQRVLRELVGALLSFVATPAAGWSFAIALAREETNELALPAERGI
jgi:hypothetical protein